MARAARKKKPAARKKPTRKTPRGKKAAPKTGLARRLWKWFRIGFAGAVAFVLFLVVLFAFVDPRITPYMFAENRRLGDIDRQWVDLDEIAPVAARSVIAAEDANFCLHWGFDMAAIRDAIDNGAKRGASTLTQQVVKNVYLWHGRSWPRKAMEAVLTPLVELVWSKRRIVEVYLNVAEFDEGVFGIEAAARNAFRRGPEELTARQAALLAAVLPDPKDRDAARPGPFTQKRATAIQDGAATINTDGRATCFQD